ncbi:LPD38 domain-containing protein [Marinobacterium litorale]|uniref:LPD38 domain-containing protein n=1 Tax=Marinobacterium litorale TaxID=404770 RepID=UPI00040123DD|nr:LPD38 domain-containing protein [Marinobacterium litorale]
MNYLSRLRDANPDLKNFSDDQIVEALPQLMPERFGNKPMSQVREEAILSPRELEIRQYEDQGGGAASSLKRGLLRANQTFNAAGAWLGDTVMDALPESVRESTFGRWLQEEADTDKRDILRDEEAIASLPQRPEMARAIDAANSAESGLDAIVAFAREVNDSPDTTGFLLDTLSEQAPQVLAQILGTKGAGVLVKGTGKASQILRMGMGGGVASSSATLGPNTARYMEGDIDNFGDAIGRAARRTGAQAAVDATTSGMIPVKIGPNQATNVAAQMALQAGGGAAGEYAGAKAVGEEVTPGELAAEGLLELITAPGDVVAAALDARRPMDDANQRIEQAGQQAAEQGGDALDQEIAKAKTAVDEIPKAAAQEKTDELTRTVSQINPADYEAPAVNRERNTTRGLDGLDGLITVAERMGFTDEVAQLVTAKRLYQQAEQARSTGDEVRAGQYADRGNRLYRSATEVNDRIKPIADQFPAPYVFDFGPSAVEGGDLVVSKEASGGRGAIYDQPSAVAGPASIKQQRSERPIQSGIIYAEEPPAYRTARADLEALREQRQADDFSARYGQEGQTPYRREPITGELDRSTELPPGRRPAELPPGTGHINMGRERPERTFTPTPTEYDGVGRNTVERTAQGQPERLPPGNATRAITPKQYRQMQMLRNQGLRTKLRERTAEQVEAIQTVEAVRAGEVEVTDSAQTQRRPLSSMTHAEVDELIQQTDGNLASSYQVDWGDMPKGQGKRSGGMVMGGMSDAVALQGVKSYGDFLGKLKETEPENYEDASLTLSGGGDRPSQIRYAKLRLAGYGHDEALQYVVLRSEEANNQLSRSAPDADIQSDQATPRITGEQIDKDWARFTPESGTLNVPRSEMPQVKAEDRGALVNYLNARGVEHEQTEVDPRVLKPTQAEFSPAKVQKAREFTGGDRSILVSADGHVVDGHHQWMAKRETGEPVKVIQLKAPINDLVSLVKDFPSSEQDAGAQAAPVGEQASPPQEFSDPVRAQELKNSIREAELLLQSGRDTLGNKLADDKRRMTERSLESSRNKLDDLRVSGAQKEQASFRIEPTDASVRVLGEPQAIRQKLREGRFPFKGAEIEGGLSFGKSMESRIRQALDGSAFGDQAIDATDERTRAKPLKFKSNGSPFASLPFRRNKDTAQVVPVEGGFAVQVDAEKASRIEAEQQAAEDRRMAQQAAQAQKAKRRYNREPDPNSDDLMAAIALGGGISRDSAEGVDPADFTRRAAGIRYVFPRRGGRTLDEMTEYLRQFGYVESYADLQDKLDRSLRGDRVLTPEGQMQQMDREAEEEARFQEAESNSRPIDDVLADQVIAARDAGVPNNVISDILNRNKDDAARAAVELDNERQRAEEAGLRSRESNEVGGRENESAKDWADQDIPWNSSRPLTDEDAADIWGDIDPEPLLTSYTEADLAEREQASRAERARQAEADRTAEQKAQADAELNDFRLSGSNAPADVATAGGQTDLLGATQTPTAVPDSDATDLINEVSRLAEAGTAERRRESFEQKVLQVADRLERATGTMVAGDKFMRDIESGFESTRQKAIIDAKSKLGISVVEATTANTESDTVTAHGVTVEVPKIDQQLADDYNRATHMGRGRDLNAELRSEAENLLNELAGRKHTLDTPEQKAKAKELIEPYLEAQAEFTRWDARFSANNPSWVVTGRSGRNMDKANSRNERHMDEYTKRVDRLRAQRKRIGDALYGMRPEAVKADQALSADHKRITQLVADIAGWMRDGANEMAAETRKWASPKAHKAIESALQRDREGTIQHLRDLDSGESAQALGGLAKILGPRSKAGGLVRDLLAGEARFSRRNSYDFQPVTRGEVEAIIGRITADWSNKPDMTVVQRESDLPADLKAAINEGNAAGQVEGVFHDGKVYLIADKLHTREDVERVLFHEVLGHYGLKQLYGPAYGYHMERMWNRLGGLNGIKRLQKKYGFNLSADWENAQTWSKEQRNRMMADEVVAHIAQRGDIQPDIIQKIAHLVREGLRKLFGKTRFGERLNRLSDVELLRIVAAAGNAVKKGETAITYTTHDPRFVRQFNELMYSREEGTEGDDAPRYSRSETAEQFDDLSDNQASFLNKIGPKTTTQKLKERITGVMDNIGLKTRQGMVDRYASLLELDKKAQGNDVVENRTRFSSWVLSKMSHAADGALSAMLTHGRIQFTDGVVELKPGEHKGLMDVLKQLGSTEEIERFLGWIAANRSQGIMAKAQDARDRAAAAKAEKENLQAMLKEPELSPLKIRQLNKAIKDADAVIKRENDAAAIDERLFTAEEVAEGVKLNRGKTKDGKPRALIYNQVFKEFQQHRDDVLAIAEEAGIITADNRAMWRDEFYVPFYRVMEEEGVKGPRISKGLSRQEAYKRLKGGKQEVNDLLENTLMNFQHLLSASLKNNAARQALKNAEIVGVATRTTETGRNKKSSTYVLENGEKVWFDIEDELVFESLSALSDIGSNTASRRLMRSFKRTFTSFTTISPQFVVANTMRDALQSIAIGNMSYNAFKNVYKGAKAYGAPGNKGQVRGDMLASGAAFSFGHIYGAGDIDALKAGIQRQIKGAKVIKSPKDVPGLWRTVWDQYTGYGDTMENANRAAIYEQNLEKGKLYAAFQARDLMDFSSQGAWPAIKFLTDVVPFLNARLVGLDRLYRGGIKPSFNVIKHMLGGEEVSMTDRQAAQRFSIVVGALTAATIALYLANLDDDRFKELEDWERDAYWHFWIGDAHFTIPKPFEIGAIATMAERSLEQAVDDTKDGKLFAERLGHILTDTFAFNPIPQIAKPMFDLYANKDSFTQRDIESLSMLRLSPENRVRANTTDVARALSWVTRNTTGILSDTLVLSPVQVDFLIQGYLGWVGAMGASTIDVISKNARGVEEPYKRWHEYQPIRRFFRDDSAPKPYTRYGTEFYDSLREVNMIYADIQHLRKLGEFTEAAQLLGENQNTLRYRKLMNRTQRQLSKINAQIKLTRANKSLSAEAKRHRIDLLTTQRNLLTERVVKVLE